MILKYRLSLFFVLLICLSSVNVIAQSGKNPCETIYEKAVSKMTDAKTIKDYEDVIKEFNNAKICSKSLEDRCNKKISECEDEIKKLKIFVLSKNDIEFSELGGTDNITVEGSERWTVDSDRDWCTVQKNNNIITIQCEPNERITPRTAIIEVTNNEINESKSISVTQKAGAEKLDVSKEALSFDFTGGTEVVRVYTNSDSWRVGSVPEWCKVKKTGMDAVEIECVKNTSKKQRYETVQLKTSQQTKGIAITQAAKPRTGKGRKVSFGVMANAVIPSFVTSATADYTGSVFNYGYGKGLEVPSYSSEVGFGVGLIADIRLVNNFYLQTGLYYTHMSLKNKFSGEYTYEDAQSSNMYIQGQAFDEYTEKYTLGYIELPILLSYRVELAEKIYWQLNAGPYVSYGISGKAKLTGETDWPHLTEYYNTTGLPTGKTYNIHCNVTGEVDLFGKSGSTVHSYTTGEKPIYEEGYSFKNSPFHNINAGVSVGTAFELHGFNIGVYYDLGLINMTNKGFWRYERVPVSDRTGAGIENYEHKLNKLQIRLGYIFRW